MDKIYRREYMDKLLALKDKQIIKIVTGVRRCGKSTLLKMFAQKLLENGVEAGQIIEINFEDMDNAWLREKEKLHQYIKTRLVHEKMTYIFLDEIQNVPDFQEVVDSIYIRDNVDLYVTGSNAHLLSGEIATLLSGRYIEIAMLPLSFKEVISVSINQVNLNDAYSTYLSAGSFPYAVALNYDMNLVNDYIQGIYNTIVLKDVVSRTGINDVSVLESIIRFVADNIGNITSSKSIADTLSSNGRKTDSKTVEKYLRALTDAYLIYNVGRYDVKGKQHLKSLSKYYLVDIGLRSILLGSKYADSGHILENIVYLELLRRGYKVHIGKVGTMEIDFVAENPKGLTYIQVSASIRDAQTFERETKPLLSVRDNYPKIILTLDNDPDANHNGIIIRNALRWLSE